MLQVTCTMITAVLSHSWHRHKTRSMLRAELGILFLSFFAGQATGADLPQPKLLDYKIQVDTILEYDGGHEAIVDLRGKTDLDKPPEYDPKMFFWYHARATAMPG